MPQSPIELIQLALEVASLESASDLPIAAIVTNSSGAVIASSRNEVVQRD